MIYLSGAVRKELVGRDDVGMMLTPYKGNRVDLSRTLWGADTGCFTNPDAYTTEAYLAWLDRQRPYFPTCLFATAPDRVGDARTTLDVALPVLPLIRRRVPAALVAQDGLERLPIPWHAFDCLFVGGTTAWKLSEIAYELVAEAKARGKWCHQGRCNSRRRFMAAAASGYDSADGTFLAFGPDKNLPKMEQWLQHVKTQKPLGLFAQVAESDEYEESA